MKKHSTFAANFALVCAVILFSSLTVFSQKTGFSLNNLADNGFAEEMRPFDFSDKYYYRNGIEPSLLVNRRDGDDKHSVFDTITDERFRNVRITTVFPAYGSAGEMIFFNLYSEVFKDGFLSDEVGDRSMETAYRHPFFIFPSKLFDGSLRQSHVIHLGDSYFEKNPLGVSVQVLVEYTDLINTDDGKQEMRILAKRNGISLDGTPIIKTVNEIADLTRKNLVTQKIRGLENRAEPSFAVAKALENPRRGAIAPDARLLMVLQPNGKPLQAELKFWKNFNCLRETGDWCGN